MRLKRWAGLCAGVLLCLSAAVQAHDVQQFEHVTSLRLTLRSDLRQREVIVLKPDAQTAGRAPAIVMLHYLHGSPADMADLTAAGRLARDAGAWVILPDAVQGKWNYGSASLKTVDDVKFLDTVIDAVAERFPIDTRRLYMSGYSNGGLMAVRYACERPERVAAVGVVATTIEQLDALRCAPAQGVAMLYINGVDDPIVPFEGNLLKRSADSTLALWRGFNGCTDTSTSEQLPDRVDDATRVTHKAWSDCSSGLPVEQYLIEGGGHTWPGTQRYTLGLGITSQDLEATEAIWQFVSRYSRP